MSNEITIVTDAELAMILNPLRKDFNCDALLCGYTTECPEQAAAHLQEEHGLMDELDFMASVLTQMRDGVVPVECQLADMWLEEQR